MRILHTVADYFPSTGGMQEAVRQISERLVRLGHDVTIATSHLVARKDEYLNGVRVVGFAIQGNAVHGLKGELDEYRDFLRNGNFEVITNFAAQQWATDLMLPLLDSIKAVKVFVPTGFSGLYLRKYRKYFAEMGEFLGRYDMCVFLSDEYRDVAFARAHQVHNRILIPNGAAEEEFSAEPALDIRGQLGIPRDHFLIITVGSHTGLKGHGDAIKILGRAAISKVTFLIIGNEYWNGCGKICRFREKLTRLLPGWQRNHKRLIVSSLTREETVAAYRQADLFLFTSTIECSPIVLFECMAAKTPFLTTDVGNAAEIIRWSGAGRLLPTEISPRGFSKAKIAEAARILEDVFADERLREQMKNAGYRVWQERFTWETIARQYAGLYESLLARRNGSSPLIEP